MRISEFLRRALGACALALVLAGCGGLPTQIGPLVPQRQTALTGPDHGGPWMAPNLKNQDLLYIANTGGGVHGNPYGDVSVYTYPEGESVGILKGFKEAYGLCVDRAGDVFVANTGGETIVEYAHGGKTPIETLRDNGTPMGCAIDSTTGDLAVTNSCDGPIGSCYPSGTVLIYKRAKGTPKALTDPFTAQMFYCAYDKDGDLFVDGGSAFRSPISLAELRKGSTAFRKIALRLTGTPGFLRWVDTHLAVDRADGNAIYQYDIFDDHARRVNTTSLKGLKNGSGTNQFWVVGRSVVAPVVNSIKYPNGFVEFFKYPTGGQPTKLIVKSMDQAEAAAVSPGQM